MSGTVIRDALETNLLSGLTLNAAGSAQNGTALEVAWPGYVQFEMDTLAVTGTSPVLTVDIQACDTSDFSTGDVVTLATLVASGTGSANRKFAATTYVDARYVRAVATVTGTSPVFTGTTVLIAPPHDRRVRDSVGGNRMSPTTKVIV